MKAEPAQQHSLLELAELDTELSQLAHRAAHLPEQLRYDEIAAQQRGVSEQLAVLRVGLEDVDGEVAKLEGEVDAVRQREDRDRRLLESGSVQHKQLEELQHELNTLERRQASLEDTLLEVMERREELAAEVLGDQQRLAALDADWDAARSARDVALAGVEQTRNERAAHRADLAAGLDAELVKLYERQRASAGIGAGRLLGRRCGACRIELDRGELARISAAPADEVLRCSECGAILLRINVSEQ